MIDIQKIKKRLGFSPDKPLTPEEKRKRSKYLIYPVFCLLFAGSLWLIYSPSGKEKSEEEKGKGFNTEIPSPEQQQMEGNKMNAYEREELAKKEKQRRGTFQEMAALFNDAKNEPESLPGATIELPEQPAANPSSRPSNTVRSSADAYRNMNHTLGNFYTRTDDSEKEKLLKRIEELEQGRLQTEQSKGNMMEEKLALMEKSYELAAKYNGNGKQAIQQVSPVDKEKNRTVVKPVKNVQQQVVSSLSQPMSDEEFIAGFAGERNRNFNTPVGKTLSSDRNTIPACVHGTQTVSDGQALRIRLLEPMVVDNRFIPKGTVLVGGTRIQGERLDIVINAVEYKGSVIPVELEVYDADGQQGILVPNSMEYDAAREIAAGMGTSMGSSINISTDAGAQIASDVGKGVIQGVSQYISKKMQTVKITLKAGHKLLLYSPEN